MSNTKFCELHQQGYLYPANCPTCEGQVLKPDVTKCPVCGGSADNGHDREYPPNPYVCTKCESGALAAQNAAGRCPYVRCEGCGDLIDEGQVYAASFGISCEACLATDSVRPEQK